MGVIAAVRMHPEDAVEKYKFKDDRDLFSVEQRVRILQSLETRHQMAVAAGGPAVLEKKGLPWITYDLTTPEGRQELRQDRKNIHDLRQMYGEDCTLISGLRGNGKTFLATYFAARFYEIGYNVISNISLDFGYVMTSGKDLLGIIYSPANTIWVIDEIHQAMNRFRQGAKFQRGVIGGLAGNRKNLSGLIGITSQDWQLGMDVKSQFKWAFFPFRDLPYSRGAAASYVGMGLRGKQPDYMFTKAYRIGPWPREWRGQTLADKRELARVRGESDEEMIWAPRPAKLVKAVPALYGSYVSLPTVKQSGGNVMAEDMEELEPDDGLELFESKKDHEMGISSYSSTNKEDMDRPVYTEAEYLGTIAQYARMCFPGEVRINRRKMMTEIVHAATADPETFPMLPHFDRTVALLNKKFGRSENIEISDMERV